MKRHLLLFAVFALTLPSGAAATAAPSQPPPRPAEAPALAPDPGLSALDAWATPSARRLIGDGSWTELADADLSRDAARGDLDRAIGILTGTPGASPDPAARLTVRTARVLVVRALGLRTELRGIARIAADGGGTLRLPRGAGAEILARELGLVYNQPSSRDARERSRNETIRLADLVYMTERARAVGSWQRKKLERYRDVRLPALGAQRLAVVQAALWQVGQPYVWAGDWPGVHSPWGAQGHGGFDCSGLVWWAFKGSPGPRQMSLGSGLLGRTADAMAFERPAEQAPIAALAPGDLVFFGPAGPKSRKGTVSHTGIALGNGWMVHSSGSRAGVSLSHLDDYWPSATAFGRRVSELGA